MDAPLDWVRAGEVTVCSKGWPSFPQVNACPGLYRISLADGRIYIGEAGDLRRRLYEYRRPTKGNEGEHLVHHELKQVGGGSLEIFVDGNLSQRRIRRRLEQSEIQAAIARGLVLLNDDGPATVRRLEAKIAHHERQIAILRSKLAALSP